MKKIGILTFNRPINYGALLQVEYYSLLSLSIKRLRNKSFLNLMIYTFILYFV